MLRSAGRVREVQRAAPVKRDGAQPHERHPRRIGPGQRPGRHLKQRLRRRRAQSAPQVPQRLLRRAGHRQAVQALQPGGQFRPDPRIPPAEGTSPGQAGKAPDAGRQVPETPLHRPRPRQHLINQVERRELLTHPGARREHPRSNSDSTGERDHGRLSTHRDLWLGTILVG
jgi:hypothetical protein